jgi:TPP-dependent pyruvate/acetoin dehydrogenase alpha subunit
MIENKRPATTLIASKTATPDSGLTADQLRQLYYFLQLNRQIETRLERLFRQGKMSGGLYSSLGQEAISVGAAFALEPKDWLAPMIRNIGALLVKGFAPRDIFTQHLARANSPTGGKDGTSHFADLKVRHTVAPSSVLGDLIPVMAGVAMAGRYLGQKIVALTFIGDGGSSTGAFHEGMNFAAAQKAPLVVILENNQWAYSTPSSKQAPLRDFADRAKAYGIRSSIVDGNDIVSVYRAAKEAVAECRAGRGPRLIEAKTMRMKGHAQHDAAEYVPKEMMDYWKTRDPLARYSSWLAAQGLLDEKQKSEIDARIETELDAEQKFAEESPEPVPESAAQGVYCEGCHKIEADWRRPKQQVMPPASTTEAVWKITDFGGYNPSSTPRLLDEDDDESAQPLSPEGSVIRVPFGRGPKDRAFVKEQPAQARQPQNRPPHKRGQQAPPRRDNRPNVRPNNRPNNRPNPAGSNPRPGGKKR